MLIFLINNLLVLQPFLAYCHSLFPNTVVAAHFENEIACKFFVSQFFEDILHSSQKFMKPREYAVITIALK